MQNALQVKLKVHPIPMLTACVKRDIFYFQSKFRPCAGVVELVDAGDSKSPGLKAHEGSIPSSGTKNIPHKRRTIK